MTSPALTVVGAPRGAVEIEIGPEIGPDGKPTAAGWRFIGRELRKPIATRQSKKRGGSFRYISARQVDERLDLVVGPGNWSTDFRVIRSEPPCAIGFGIALYGVWKWAVGYSNNPEALLEWIEDRDKQTGARIVDPNTGEVRMVRNPAYEHEPLKAAESDARKRAAVQWGIARGLYPEMAQ